MPCQAPHFAARGRDDVHVDVPVVVAGEGEPLAVIGKDRIALVAVGGRDPADVAAVELRGPDIAGVDERDVRRAHRGLREHAGSAVLGERLLVRAG
jgi:hypothetical protein